MYRVVSKVVEGIPFCYEKIPEAPVQISVKDYLRWQGYQNVKREQQPFYIPFAGRNFKQRVDVIGFQGEDVLIVECKSSLLDSVGLCSAILQLSIYLRLYKMSAQMRNPQLFFQGPKPGLIRDGRVEGALAFPCTAFRGNSVAIIDQLYESLEEAKLLEPDIEIWLLSCDDWPVRAIADYQRV